MTTFLADIGTVLTSAAGWIASVAGVIMSTPVLLVPCALGIAFTAIVMIKSLRH